MTFQASVQARSVWCAAAVAVLFIGSSSTRGQSRLLDDCDSLAGWSTIVSDGAHLRLARGEGKTGGALAMEFDLSGVYGYVIAEKEFPIDLPPNYQFTFDLRGETPLNNFEFKVIDDRENVFWIKKLNVEYPKEWAKQRIKKRHLSFAWGPAPGRELRMVRKVQFVVSVGTGGRGRILIDNFRFEPLDDSAAASAVAEIVGARPGAPGSPAIDAAGTLLTDWQSAGTQESDSLVIDFHRRKELGGLVIDWDSSDFALSYDILLSDDGREWLPAYRVASGKPGRAYVATSEAEGNAVKLVLHKSSRAHGYRIHRMAFKGPEFSGSANSLFRAMAADAPSGYFPKYLQDRQSYWTVVGVNGDTKEALINEQGQIEVDKVQFSLEPFLYVDGRLVTWSDVSTTPSLLGDYLPIPSVTWRYKDAWILTVQAVAAGVPDNSILGVKYSLQSKTGHGKGKLFIAMRPFQVNPPWQQLNIEGGVSRIDSIVYRDGMVQVNGLQVIPLTAPSAFGAAEFDQGQITEYLARGAVPPLHEVRDHFGHASAALQYDVGLASGETTSMILAVPFHRWRGSPMPNQRGDSPQIYYDLMLQQTASVWADKLDRVQITLPASAQQVVNTIKSNLAYIDINRDGPGIQPGSRSYERSWIRDGSLTCSALLRMGNSEEVRQFLDWYAKGQFPSGKIPCVIDSRGPDAVPEHDSHGEFIFAVLQYFRFTGDTVWLRGKFEAIAKTVRYIQSLRAERKTDVYRSGTPEQRACFGLVPESISHEGYWDVPRHSYWDDFFILRGLKDATAIAGILREKKLQTAWAAERDDFRTDLYASMRLAMKNANINYIPGCVELGDFDATSTTIGVDPGGELGNIPEPQLHNTFDRYYAFFSDRIATNTFTNYTPYETRVIGTFVRLGQKKRAEEAMDFFMHDRRPAAWNHWAEVVWRDPEAPKYIGDMPHTWVGSDFIRSVVSMFVYERERDGAHLLCAGIPDRWVSDSAGVVVKGLSTPYGQVSFSLRKKGKVVVADVSGSFDAANHRLVIHSPLAARPRSATIGGRRVTISESGEIVLKKLPARVEFTY